MVAVAASKGNQSPSKKSIPLGKAFAALEERGATYTVVWSTTIFNVGSLLDLPRAKASCAAYVLSELKRGKARSVSALARRLRLNRNTVAEYLDLLRQDNAYGAFVEPGSLQLTKAGERAVARPEGFDSRGGRKPVASRVYHDAVGSWNLTAAYLYGYLVYDDLEILYSVRVNGLEREANWKCRKLIADQLFLGGAESLVKSGLKTLVDKRALISLPIEACTSKDKPYGGGRLYCVGPNLPEPPEAKPRAKAKSKKPQTAKLRKAVAVERRLRRQVEGIEELDVVQAQFRLADVRCSPERAIVDLHKIKESIEQLKPAGKGGARALRKLAMKRLEKAIVRVDDALIALGQVGMVRIGPEPPKLIDHDEEVRKIGLGVFRELRALQKWKGSAITGRRWLGVEGLSGKRADKPGMAELIARHLFEVRNLLEDAAEKRRLAANEYAKEQYKEAKQAKKAKEEQQAKKAGKRRLGPLRYDSRLHGTARWLDGPRPCRSASRFDSRLHGADDWFDDDEQESAVKVVAAAREVKVKSKSPQLISTGLRKVDELLGGGMQPRGVYSIIGAIGAGKSLFLGQLAVEAGKRAEQLAEGRDMSRRPISIYLEYEQDRGQTRRRALACATGQDEYELSGRIPTCYSKHLRIEQPAPPEPGDNPAAVVERDVEKILSELPKSYPVLVAVSYAGLLVDKAYPGLSGYALAPRLDLFAEEMRGLAKKWNCPVWVAQQATKKANDYGPAARLKASDVKGSRKWCSYFDAVLGLGRYAAVEGWAALQRMDKEDVKAVIVRGDRSRGCVV